MGQQGQHHLRTAWNAESQAPPRTIWVIIHILRSTWLAWRFQLEKDWLNLGSEDRRVCWLSCSHGPRRGWVITFPRPPDPPFPLWSPAQIPAVDSVTEGEPWGFWSLLYHITSKKWAQMSGMRIPCNSPSLRLPAVHAGNVFLLRAPIWCSWPCSGPLQTDGLGKCWGYCRSLQMCPLISSLAPVPALARLLRCPWKSARDEAKRLPGPAPTRREARRSWAGRMLSWDWGRCSWSPAGSAGYWKTRHRLVFGAPVHCPGLPWVLAPPAPLSTCCWQPEAGAGRWGGCQREATGYSSELRPPCCLWKQLSVGAWPDAFHREWLSSGLWPGLCGGGCWTERGPGGREGGPVTVADGIQPRADGECLLQYAFPLLISSWAELIN